MAIYCNSRCPNEPSETPWRWEHNKEPDRYWFEAFGQPENVARAFPTYHLVLQPAIG